MPGTSAYLSLTRVRIQRPQAQPSWHLDYHASVLTASDQDAAAAAAHAVVTEPVLAQGAVLAAFGWAA